MLLNERMVEASVLGNEKHYKEEDLEGMLEPREISGDEMQGDYFAIGNDGKAYEGTFVNKGLPGGVFYSVIPSGIKVLGYVPVNQSSDQKSEVKAADKSSRTVKRRMNRKRGR